MPGCQGQRVKGYWANIVSHAKHRKHESSHGLAYLDVNIGGQKARRLHPFSVDFKYLEAIARSRQADFNLHLEPSRPQQRRVEQFLAVRQACMSISCQGILGQYI